MKRLGMLLLWAWWLPVHGAPVRLLAGAGDCRDGELGAHVAALRAAVAAQGGQRLVGAEAVKARLRPAPSRTPEELSRAVEGARQRLYEGDFGSAQATLGAVLADVVRLPPGEARFGAWTAAQLLLGQVHRGRGQEEAGDEALRRVLRLSPGLVLDPDLHSPSTRARFEALRAALAAGPRVAVEVRSTPPGADVFLEGRPVGVTPWLASLPPAHYRLEVAAGPLLSFPRVLDATQGAATARVNLAFEGHVVERAGEACLDAASESPRLGHAVLLGALLGAEEVAVLSLERVGTEPGWLGVTLLSVPGGDRLRAAGLQLEPGHAGVDLAPLASWLATGSAAGPVSSPPPRMPEVALGLLPPGSTAERAEAGMRRNWAVGLACAGVALLATGVGLQLSADAAARAGTPQPLQQGMAWGALGVGSASVAATAVLLAWPGTLPANPKEQRPPSGGKAGAAD